QAHAVASPSAQSGVAVLLRQVEAYAAQGPGPAASRQGVGHEIVARVAGDPAVVGGDRLGKQARVLIEFGDLQAHHSVAVRHLARAIHVGFGGGGPARVDVQGGAGEQGGRVVG